MSPVPIGGGRPGVGGPGRGEPSRAQPRRAEPSRAEPSRIGRQAPAAPAQKFRPAEIVYPERERRLWQDQLRRRLKVVGGAAGIVLLGVAAYFIVRPPVGCDASPERQRAVATVIAHRDRASGETLDSRFPRDRFECSDAGSPGGVLISATENDDAPPAVWYVDGRGTPHNVNMLALVWTPQFATAPKGIGTTAARDQ